MDEQAKAFITNFNVSISMVEDLNVAGNQLLRREFSRLKFDKRNAKRIEASLKAWANEDLRLVKRFKKLGGQIPPGEKFCLRLPLSGSRLKILGEQGEWELSKPSEIDTSESEFKGFPVEVHCINQFRNDTEYEIIYSDEAIILLLRVLNLVHEFAKTLEEGNLCDAKGKTHFLFVEKILLGVINFFRITSLTINPQKLTSLHRISLPSCH